MTAQSGTDPAAKDAGGDTASPYGTRSRNRHSNARPNYAEDKDIEMDVYDFYHDKKDGDGKKSSRQAGIAANGEVTRGAANSRKAAAGGDDSKAASSQNGSKDQTPSASSVASPATQPVTTSSQPTRKRKAAAQSSGTTGQAATGGGGGGSSRRAAVANAQAHAHANTNGTANASASAAGARQQSQQPQQAQSASGISWPETNMLTFDDCKARPDSSGRMVADDGTVLEPNGKHGILGAHPIFVGKSEQTAPAESKVS